MAGSLILFMIAAQWVAIIVLGVFLLGAFNALARLEREIASIHPRASQLEKGEGFPIDLGVPLPSRAFIAIVSYGCSGCVELCKRLQSIDVDGWEFVIIVRGKPLSLDSARVRYPEQEETAGVRSLPLPKHAVVLRDESEKWSRQLGVRGVPAVLALVGGRLVDQYSGPPPDAWFTAVQQRRRESGKEVLSVNVRSQSGA